MNPNMRSRHSSTTESESATDVSCADSIPAPLNSTAPIQHQQRFILTPNMYFQDTVYRTFSYAPPPPPPIQSMAKNFAPILPPEVHRTSLSTCIKQADSSSYRYRYYAPAGPVPASRLIKGEAAPKRFAPIEQSISFQNFPAPRYPPANRSFDGSYRNISFEPMNYESRSVEQYNRPVANMWQMNGSSANTTNSSQKFLNQYQNDALQPRGVGATAGGYNQYFQDKNFANQSPIRLKNKFKLKAFAIIGLVLIAVISIAVILSVLITRSTMSSSSTSFQNANQRRLLNSSLVNLTNGTMGNMTDNNDDSIFVGVDISLNVTSDRALFLDNSSNSNKSYLNASAARLIKAKFNSTSTNSNLGLRIIDKYKSLNTSNGTIYDSELIDMISSYSSYSNSTNSSSVTLN